MKIAVTVKQVPDSWAEKKFVSGRVDRESVDAVLNDLDEYAIEEALRIVEPLNEVKRAPNTRSHSSLWDQSELLRRFAKVYPWEPMAEFWSAIQL